MVRRVTRQQHEVVIAVIGVTGAGKTTFVCKATGRDDLQIGHGIDSCTQEVTPVSININGQQVTLIDTPGFDDSERSDTDILDQVAQYMTETFQRGVLLTGIIFLQPINQPRLQGSEMRRTRLFKKLLGEDAYKRVVIATTMWSDIPEAEARFRQEERKSRHDVWGDMVSAGAKVVRHDDTQESARNIIQTLATFDTPVELQIQRELLANGGKTILTSAGKQLNADLHQEMSKMTREIENLKREIEQMQREKENTALEMRELEERERRLRDNKEQQKKLEESNTCGSCVVM